MSCSAADDFVIDASEVVVMLLWELADFTGVGMVVCGVERLVFGSSDSWKEGVKVKL